MAFFSACGTTPTHPHQPDPGRSDTGPAVVPCVTLISLPEATRAKTIRVGRELTTSNTVVDQLRCDFGARLLRLERPLLVYQEVTCSREGLHFEGRAVTTGRLVLSLDGEDAIIECGADVGLGPD